MDIGELIDMLERRDYGIMFVDMIDANMVPYDMFTEEELRKITALYIVRMTQEIFDNGLDSLDGVDYLKVEVNYE